MASPVAKAYGLANEVVGILQTWIQADKQKSIHISFTKEQQLKLLKLRLLSERYKLDIPEILDILVPLMRDRFMHNKRTFGLGININVLCGQAAERWLFEELKKHDSDDDHIVEFKARARDRQIEAELALDSDGVAERVQYSALDAPSIPLFIEAYSKRVLSKRTEDEKMRNDPSRRRKPYRGNPWL